MSLGKYLKDFPELSRGERSEVLNKARRASMHDLSRSLRGIAVFTLAICGGFVVFAIVKVAFKIAGLGLSPVYSSAIAGGIGAVVPTFIVQARLPRYVFVELRARGHDVCPSCGYVRRGLDADSPCPECGESGPGPAGSPPAALP